MNNRWILMFCFLTTYIAIYCMDNKKLLTRTALVALEGIDSAQKSTLAENIWKDLTKRGFDVVLTQQSIDKELSLSSIAESTDNKLILCDRISDSSIAYQTYNQGSPFTTIQKVDKGTMTRKKADLTIFLNIPVKTVLAHCNKRNDLSLKEKEQLLRNFREKSIQIYFNRLDVIEADETELIEDFGEAIHDWLKENNFCS